MANTKQLKAYVKVQVAKQISEAHSYAKERLAAMHSHEGRLFPGSLKRWRLQFSKQYFAGMMYALGVNPDDAEFKSDPYNESTVHITCVSDPTKTFTYLTSTMGLADKLYGVFHDCKVRYESFQRVRERLNKLSRIKDGFNSWFNDQWAVIEFEMLASNNVPAADGAEALITKLLEGI